MTLFKNKYRVETIRAQWWDYSSNGTYFITICTKDRYHFFGQIRDGEMGLSDVGQIAQSCWMEIPRHFPFVELGEFIVMPDHVHGIVRIDKGVAAQNFVQPPPTKNTFGPQSQNLASVIRGYKVGVTKGARQINPLFQWQTLYYDVIIRNQQSYDRISQYIRNNPSKWKGR